MRGSLSSFTMLSAKTYIHDLDRRISRSTFGRVFHLAGSGHEKEHKHATFLTEIRAGMTTFFTMAYIIAVNSSIVSQSGGLCECKSTTDPTCLNDDEYNSCLSDLSLDLITATAAIAGISSFLFGFLTNLPVALAPGMGLNAYFTYQVVGYHGTGSISYKLALTAVFVEGFVFVFLSLMGIRQWLVKIVPESIKVASGVGIGLFLTEIGLSNAAGIGAISGSTDSPLQLAGCESKYINPATGQCESHDMENPAMWIGIFVGGLFTAYLMAYRFKSAIMVGIAVVSIISWPRDTSFTYFPHDADGDARFEFFRQVIAFHPIRSILGSLDWNLAAAGVNGSQFILALFTFLYVDVIDCTATVYSMARFSGAVDPETGDFPRSTLAYCTDAICISIGALMGLPPVTAFVESGAGIAEGGRSGLTAITTGICFLLSIFFAPIFASIPPWATGCTLILVGCMMMRQVGSINWRYIGDAVPAFVTLIFMPMSYSVAYGLIAGLMAYVTLNGLIYITKVISGGRITPPDADLQEYWTYKPQTGSLPWFIRFTRSGAHVWHQHQNQPPDDEDEPEAQSKRMSNRLHEVEIHSSHSEADGISLTSPYSSRAPVVESTDLTSHAGGRHADRRLG